jgi:hypothetical protein
MKKRFVIAAALMVLPAMSAFAANPNPAFKLRHQNFEAMGKAMKGIFDEFKKPAANMATIIDKPPMPRKASLSWTSID